MTDLIDNVRLCKKIRTAKLFLEYLISPIYLRIPSRQGAPDDLINQMGYAAVIAVRHL
jgi:hypothetical protein